MQQADRLPGQQDDALQNESRPGTGGQQVTHNLDTGQDEPLTNLESEDDESIMNFGDGSGGGSATDGGAA